MQCPNCHSENCHVNRDVTKQGYGLGKGCCGFILMGGPLGLLCGFCGKDKVMSEENYWLCNNCGRKFSEREGLHGMALHQAKVKVDLAGSRVKENPDFEKIIAKKEEARKRLKATLTSKELERFVFFETGMEDKRAAGIFFTYRKFDHPLEKECIYFMYSESIIGDGTGLIVASNGIYYIQGVQNKFMPAYQISKVFMDGKSIHIGNSKNRVSFDYIKELESRAKLADILKFLYVEGREHIEATTKTTAYGNHISRGILADIDGKLYYGSKDRFALVVKDGEEERIFYKDIPMYLFEYDGFLYMNYEGNYIGRFDPNTAEVSCVLKNNCVNVHQHNGTFAFTNVNDKDRLYLIEADGSNVRKVLDDKVTDITLTDEWIYYINLSDKKSIYKVKVDGTERTKIYGNMKCCDLIYDGSYLYFRSSNFDTLNELYRLSEIDGSVEKITDNVEDYIVTETTIYVSRDDGIIYINKDELENAYYFLKDTKANNLCVINGYLYFNSPKGIANHYISHRVDCEGGKIEAL